MQEIEHARESIKTIEQEGYELYKDVVKRFLSALDPENFNLVLSDKGHVRANLISEHIPYEESRKIIATPDGLFDIVTYRYNSGRLHSEYFGVSKMSEISPETYKQLALPIIKVFEERNKILGKSQKENINPS